MGIVYKAEDTRLKRIVALKFLPQELTKEREAKERFLQEAQAAAALDHPNICTVYEVDDVEGHTFIAMAFIAGQSLKEKIGQGRLDVGESLDIVSQVAAGLKEAHGKGIIHRDIKPANIMLARNGQAKIMDFGLAKLERGADLTRTATIMGTVAYMSPEQARGEKVDHRTDTWSLGAVLYEMLTGVKPFPHTLDQAAIHAILHDEPAPLASLRQGLPPELQTIVDKALRKNPAERYPRVEDFIRDLVMLTDKIKSASGFVPASEPSPSIAVLPFDDMSPQKDQEYFCDGITEEIINVLSQTENLRVIARTSAFSFKGKHEDVRQIGRKLGVGALLEGSLRKAGNRLRVTAQLIDTRDGSHIWSGKYDRELRDVFSIQDEIAAAIVSNLEVKLLSPEKTRSVARHSRNLRAYEAYLRGLHYANKMSGYWFEKAISSYEEAVSIDPSYALAHAAMAEAYIYNAFFGWQTHRESIVKGKESIEKALQLDPALPEAHLMKAFVATYHDWDGPTAAREYRRALELYPNSSRSLMRYAIFLEFYEERHKEALETIDKAEELDPLDLLVKIYRVWLYSYQLKFDVALEEAQKIVALEPSYPLGHYWLGCAYGYKGEYEPAVAALEEAVRIGGRSIPLLGELGYSYGKVGRGKEAEAVLVELKEMAEQGQEASSSIARVYLGLGKVDEVFEWLEKAYIEHEMTLYYAPKDPAFAEISSDSRFISLTNRIRGKS